MGIENEAVEVCREAERALRALMRRAVGAGEYRHLPLLARMAEQLSVLVARAEQSSRERSQLSVVAEGRAGTGARVDARLVATGEVALRTSRKTYPRFEREGDNMVKIGWSKTARTEYEHRAPRRAVDAMLHAIVGAGAPGVVFTVERLLPVLDPYDRSEIPGYQVYLALAWFRTEGIVEQHGREGYSLSLTSNIEQTVDERWSALLDRGQSKGDRVKP